MKQGFLRLPFVKKAILLGSMMAMISTIMPWYDQRNSVGIGDTYLGIQGPLFVIGVLVLGFAGVTFFNLFLPLLGRNFFNLRRKSGVLSLILGAESLLFLLVGNVIFYNPDFGLSSSTKGTRFGMMVAFLSVGLMMIAGYFAKKYEKNEAEETLEFNVEEQNVEPAQSTYASPSTASYQNPPTYSPSAGHQIPVQTSLTDKVDPLTLDVKTRYKMMQSQTRYSSSARGNLWGGGNGSAFQSQNTKTVDLDHEPTDY
ncbi:MAG: hypothetical protein WC897_05150 [Candidatus Gracilibacteria bacterium]